MRLRLLLVLAALLPAACRDEKIISYRVPKEESPQTVPGADGMAGAATSVPPIHWRQPDGWKEQPPGSVRIGSFAVSGPNGAQADMSVTTFPGDVGGALANVNRWRGQLGLAPIDADAMPAAITTVDAPAGKFSLVELSGKTSADSQKPARMLGAWLKQNDRTWFFKLVGDDALVSAQRGAFMTFLQSVDISATPAGMPPASADTQAPAAGQMPASGAPPFAPFMNGGGAMPDSGAMPPAPAPSAAALTWTDPAGWEAKVLSTMRLGSFNVRGAEGDADISVIAFPGEAGGLIPNLNRWRGQVGLAPASDNDMAAAITTIDGAGGLRFTAVDFAGQAGGAPTRLVGAILSYGGQTYFFKMLGPDALVAREKPAFLNFLKTVKAP